MNHSKPVVLLGNGGHASVLADILLNQNIDILATVSPDKAPKRKIFTKIKQLYHDDDVLDFQPDAVELVNGIGMMPECSLRADIFHYFKDKGYRFKTLISTQAVVSNFAQIEEGAQIMHGCIIQAGAHILQNSIINTAAIIEHDCVIGAHNHIAPKVIVCGNSTTDCHVFIGSGATLIQNITIGQQSVIAAGAIITKNVAKQHYVYGAQSFVQPVNK